MKEIQLNKALYNEKGARPAGGAKDGTPAGPPVREPRGSLFARLGALLVDLLLLHGAAMVVVKLTPSAVVKLGPPSAWVGLLVGLIYFAVGYGPSTGGRTLGKMVVRLRVADLTGPPMPASRAALRAVLFLAPAAMYLAATQIDEFQFRPDALAVFPFYGLLGLAFMISWILGNALFAMADPHGRSWIDRFCGAVIVTTDAPVEAQGTFVRSAREDADPVRLRKSRMYLGGTVITLLILAGFWLHLNKKMLTESPERMREVWMARNTAFHVAGFLPPYKIQDEAPRRDGKATSSNDGQTSVVVYQYYARHGLDAAELKTREDVNNAVDRVAGWFTDTSKFLAEEQGREAEKARAEGKPVPAFQPLTSEKFRIRTSFAEYADLFWASNAHEVLSLERMVDLSDTGTTTAALAE
ncbi:hypothetical protein CVU37_05320 [candidate division BRC1 bacterium HGW-BRC1-1]|jgi:uncharacterized RDD family membrane protein YckC|nr:MAG: hypothetical protein CVU37_05320 [candidate division BRC1 bacterium HGW-BRC1-1]